MKSKYPNGIIYPDSYQNEFIADTLKEFFLEQGFSSEEVGGVTTDLLFKLAEFDLKIGWQLVEYVTHAGPVPIEGLPEALG